MNPLQRLLQAIDNFQRQRPVLSFIYAVIKKYGEDNGSYQSALITYYAVFSLFPLLIVFTTLTQLLLRSDSALRLKVSGAIARYFPIIGSQLQDAVHSPKKTGAALLVSLLITLYGARGGASALQFSVSSLWQVSPLRQPGFPKNIFRSLGIIGIGGLGLVAASMLAGYTAILGHGIIIKLLSVVVSVLVLWGTFLFLFKLAAAGNKHIQDVIIGAAVSAVGIQLLQTLGSTILAHELRNLRGTTGTFALVIALMFWIYLQAQLIIYSVEVDVIRKYHLFPRSLQPPLTDADKLTYARAAQARRRATEEQVKVSFP